MKEVSNVAIQAIVVSEDWSFYKHNGIDFIQLKKAFLDTITEGKKLRGASTISQQVVKNLFYSNKRSYLRKINEAWITKTMEQTLSKDRILEIYLNIVELGQNIYGIKRASRYYFNKLPKNLTPKEGAFLAMLLPSPKKYAISFKNKKLTNYATKRVNTILRFMSAAKFISKDVYHKQVDSPMSWEKEKGRTIASKPTN